MDKIRISLLKRKYENARYLIQSKWSKLVKFYQKKLPEVAQEILENQNKTKRRSCAPIICRELLHWFLLPTPYKNMLLRHLFLSAECWRLFDPVHVLHKLNNLAGLKRVSEKYYHHLSFTVLSNATSLQVYRNIFSYGHCQIL